MEKLRAITLPQLCYDIAYFMLPPWVFHKFETLRSLCQESLSAAGPYCYLKACQMRKVEPDFEIAQRFKWHTGTYAGRPYLALEYPTISDFECHSATLEQVVTPAQLTTPAPYWSVIFWEGEREYFILGQSPLVGTTTVRQILLNRTYRNLGPGPPPTLDGFLAAIAECGQA